MKRVVSILICITIVLLGSIRIVARFDYHGLLLAYNYGITVGDLPADPSVNDIEQYKNGSVVEYDCYRIFRNRFGKVALAKIDFGGTYKMKLVGTFPQKLKNHFTMLSLWEGMSMAQLIQAVGAPNCRSGSGISVLTYIMKDGYYYDIYYAERDAGLTYFNIFDSNGEPVDKTAFQWQIRFAYIALAAALSVVLVCLLVIPKQIEKRKKKPLPNE